MKIETLEVAGLRSAALALRLPYNRHSTERGNFAFDSFNDGEGLYVSVISSWLHDMDISLMRRLIRSGDEHAKVVRGIIAWAEITAPIYWWCEMECYRIGHERLSSESTMHGIAKGLEGDELVRVKSELPMGTELTKIDFFSYQTLRRIVIQRHSHRLPEWHRFVDWAKSLPLSRELIFCGTDIPFEGDSPSEAAGMASDGV